MLFRRWSVMALVLLWAGMEVTVVQKAAGGGRGRSLRSCCCFHCLLLLLMLLLLMVLYGALLPLPLKLQVA